MAPKQYPLTASGDMASGERNRSRMQDPRLTYAEIAFAHRRAPVVQGFDEG
jgi:hypothetical protein